MVEHQYCKATTCRPISIAGKRLQSTMGTFGQSTIYSRANSRRNWNRDRAIQGPIELADTQIGLILALPNAIQVHSSYCKPLPACVCAWLVAPLSARHAWQVHNRL